MSTSPAVESRVLEGLNAKQREAVTHVDGPLLIIAGPGSGKTHTLVRRTLYIIEQGLARPEEIVLCTFTEKAALELRDRVRNEAVPAEGAQSSPPERKPAPEGAKRLSSGPGRPLQQEQVAPVDLAGRPGHPDLAGPAAGEVAVVALLLHLGRLGLRG